MRSRKKKGQGIYRLLEQSETPLFQTYPTIFGRMKRSFFTFLVRFSRKRMRTIKGSKTRKSVITERAGRNIKLVKYRYGENTLAPFQTVINAVFNGKYDLSSRDFAIDNHDFVGWERLERESLTLVMVVDVSQSTFPFIHVFAEILNSLTGYFKTHRDRIGLISLQGTQAKIMNHPTHNYRIVTRSLLKLKIRGETPLADGLQKALAMVKLEKYRKPGSRNVVILLSDCYPEPITGRFKNIFDEPAYRETMRAASIYRKNRISLLVINPGFSHRNEEDYSAGEKLAHRIVRESDGRLIRLYRKEEMQTQGTYLPPSNNEIRQIISGVEQILGSKGLSEGERNYLR